MSSHAKMNSFQGCIRAWLLSCVQLFATSGTVAHQALLYMVFPRQESEKAMAPHSSALAWKIPWMEEPGRLQSMGSRRVEHDWPTSLSLSCIGEGDGNPLQCSCLENPRDGGAWWAAIHGVAWSRTRLKWLSSSSSSRTGKRLMMPSMMV